MGINLSVLTRIEMLTASLLSGLAVLSLVAYAGLYVAGYRPAAVYSGSMVPKMPVGSLVFERTVPASTVKVGDVITFNDPYVPGKLVTHRIIRIANTDHGRAYWTKGDANPSRDPWTIALPDKVGKASFSVPYAGYLLVYAKTREVRTGLIILASIALLGGLLWKIWKPRTRRPIDGLQAPGEQS
jgi:signal peptidase